MTQVEKALAPDVLMNGALGVGESHDNPEGRELVRDLIQAGLVTTLFLEFGSYNNNTIEKAVGEFEDRRSVDAMMTTLALSFQESGISREESPEGLTFVRPGLGELAFLAIKRGVRVVCADPKINRGWSDPALRMRNVATAKVVAQTLDCVEFGGVDAAGALLLFGSDHFRGSTGLNIILPGLRWVLTPTPT